MTFGGDPQDIILSLAFTDYESNEKTMGGKVWWINIEITDQFRIQQNIISKHFRILEMVRTEEFVLRLITNISKSEFRSFQKIVGFDKVWKFMQAYIKSMRLYYAL